MQNICDFLGSEMVGYDWVGFYLSDVKIKNFIYDHFMENPRSIPLFPMEWAFAAKQPKLKNFFD